MNKIIIFGDAHLETMVEPDKSYLLLKKVITTIKPSEIVINGDLLDFSYISSFADGVFGAQEGKRLKDDFDIFKKELQFFKKYSKKVIFLEGNHEARLNKYLEKNPVLKGIMSLQTICEELNIEYVPLNQQPYAYRPDFWITHGLCYNKYFASKTVEQCNVNIVCSHTHRTQSYSISYPNGKIITGYGIGCLSNINPDYTAGLRQNGWTHSFGELLEDESGFQFNTIIIENDSCIVNGKRISLNNNESDS